MTKFILMLAVGAAAPGAAFAQSLPQTCVRGTDERVIEVLAPGEIGAACDLRYTRDGGANISVPYHANSDVAWCEQKAADLIENLQGSGFSCERVAPAAEVAASSEVKLVLEEDAPGDVAPASNDGAVETRPDAVASAEPPAQAPATSSAPQTRIDLPAEIIAEGDVAAPALEEDAPPPLAPVVADTGAQPQSQPVSQVEAPQEPVEQPAPVVSAESEPLSSAPVSGNPVNLTAEAKPSAVRIAPPSSGAGRLIGALPQESDSPQQLVIPSAQEAVAPTYATSTRPAVDIIKGVLAAQAAAWNEGDLAAFMAGYWNSPDLRFISDGYIAKGWREVMKRYQSLYATPADMGRLAFSDLDVKSITDDVAVVTGRYTVAAAPGVSSGTFSLVMKRFDGRWRIVHDHSVSDAAPAE